MGQAGLRCVPEPLESLEPRFEEIANNLLELQRLRLGRSKDGWLLTLRAWLCLPDGRGRGWTIQGGGIFDLFLAAEEPKPVTRQDTLACILCLLA